MTQRFLLNPWRFSIFKRFTSLVVEFFKEKFVWAKKKPAPVSVDAQHDRSIAENYVFDKVKGIYVPRVEDKRRAKFNNDNYKPTFYEVKRFPTRPQHAKPITDSIIDLKASIPIVQMRKRNSLKLRPPGYRDRK
jgi:hypothetical protein